MHIVTGDKPLSSPEETIQGTDSLLQALPALPVKPGSPTSLPVGAETLQCPVGLYQHLQGLSCLARCIALSTGFYQYPKALPAKAESSSAA